MSRFGYASGYNVPSAELEEKILCTNMYVIGHKFDILFEIPFLKRNIPVSIESMIIENN